MKTLVITGGSRGIGHAAATLFAQHGYRIVNVSRAAIDIPGAVQIVADLAEPHWPDQHGVAAKLERAVAGSSEIAVVHSAGLLAKDAANAIEAGAFRRALQVNVVAPSQLNQLLLPAMARGSSILYVGSTLGEKAVPGACSYVVSKHAVIGLMRSTCQDLAGSGVHTACVCPGFTDTEMLRAHVGNSREILESLATGMTFGRLIEPVEIARTLLFCAQHAVINGAVIHANLGQVER